MYQKSDEDLLNALKIKPNDAYILNYLAYSWLERDYKIDEAIIMLEKAYALKKNDPYIIDSIGWAYYLINDYEKAEKFLRKAVELMPDDPIVNDHYGDILWKLNRKIQARYFWTNVLNMDDADKEILEKINVKLLEGLKIHKMNSNLVRSYAKINAALNILEKKLYYIKLKALFFLCHYMTVFQ